MLAERTPSRTPSDLPPVRWSVVAYSATAEGVGALSLRRAVGEALQTVVKGEPLTNPVKGYLEAFYFS